MELTFVEGQAVVDLADGTTLSILNAEREHYIRRYTLFGPTETYCDPDTFEVALTPTGEEGCAGPIDDLANYEYVRSDNWIIYGWVPLSAIEAYVAKVGQA